MTKEQLPAGWVWTTLSEVLTSLRNGISDTPNAATGLPILRISAVRPGSVNTGDRRFLETDAKYLPYLLERGDLLFTRFNGNADLVGACGVVRTIDGQVVYPDKLIRGRVDNRAALPEFVEAALRTARAQAHITQKRKTAAGQVGISGDDLKGTPVPLAPVNEQRRIVATIGALTERSRRAKEALDAIPGLLERYRQSVLAAAFRGDLTRDWRDGQRGLPQGAELLARLRAGLSSDGARANKTQPAHTDSRARSKSLRQQPAPTSGGTEVPEVPVHWAWTVAADVVEAGAEIVYGIVQPGPVVSDGIPYVRGMDIENGRILEEQLLRTHPDIAARYARASLRGGDVLLGIIRATKVAIVPVSLTGANITQGTARLRPSKSITTAFLAYWLESKWAQDWLHARYRGIDMPGLNLRDVRQLPIPLASLEEQLEIVSRIESRLSAHAHVREVLSTASDMLKTLDRSILTRAFRGELVPQDPADEPASVLLDRIRAERAASTPTRPAARSTPRTAPASPPFALTHPPSPAPSRRRRTRSTSP